MKDKKMLEKWKEELKEEVFFWVGIEIKRRDQGTFIDIIRYFKGDADIIPTIEQGLVGKGEFANRNLIEKLLKSAADTILVNAPDEVIDDIVLETGDLHNFIKDLFVDAYFKMEFMRIVNTTLKYDDFEKILDVGENEIIGGAEAEMYLSLPKKDLDESPNS